MGWQRGLDKEYPQLNHISEADLFRGYAGLARPVSTRVERRRTELAARIAGESVPDRALLRGRRCPCGRAA